MTTRKTNRVKWLHLRLTEEENKKITEAFKKTTCRKLSQYARKILFGKPVTLYQRNQSLDEFMEEMILLRNELNAIGNNFNQAVKRLHSLDHLPGLITWIRTNESLHHSFLSKTEEIKNKINQIADKWLQ
jgi:hypothetical protein